MTRKDIIREQRIVSIVEKKYKVIREELLQDIDSITNGEQVDNFKSFLQKYHNAPFAIFSAYRGNDNELDIKNTETLRNELNKRYYTIEVDGRFENGNVETSFIVSGINLSSAAKYSGMYNQNAFIYAVPNKNSENGFSFSLYEGVAGNEDTTKEYKKTKTVDTYTQVEPSTPSWTNLNGFYFNIDFPD